MKNYQLDDNTLHFWLIKLPPLPQKVNRRIFATLKHERRLILNYILKHYSTAELTIVENPSGKPYLLNAQLEFNTSHSGQYLAIAIAKTVVGVDIEKFKQRDYAHFSSRFFSQHFYQHLLSLPSYMQGLVFFKQWAKTESWVKMLGNSVFNFPEISANAHFLSFMPKIGLTASICTMQPVKLIQHDLDWSYPASYQQQLETLYEQALQDIINPNLKIHWLETVDSTQNYLKNLPSVLTPMLCCSQLQTKGRGRLGREWLSPGGVNIYFSLRITVAKLEALSLVIALSIIKTLQEQLGINAQVKWPNDIYVNHKKIAGVLIEVLKNQQVIIGVGVNVNATNDMLPETASSLYEILHEQIDIKLLFSHLVTRIYQDIKQFEQEGFESFKSTWQSCDLLQDKNISVKQNNMVISGRARGVTNQGYLIIESKNRSFVEVGSGEATIQFFPREKIE